VLGLVTAAVHLVDIFRPGWSRVRSAVSIAGHVVAIGLVIVLVQSGPLVAGVFVEGASSVKDPVGVLDVMLKYALVLAAAGWTVGLAVELWRFIKSSRAMSPPSGIPA
jgi:hypothetical protein